MFSTTLFFLTILLALLATVLFGLHYANLLDNGFTELNNFKNLYNPLGKKIFDQSIRYSPNILESIFYKEFQTKYPKIVEQVKNNAVKGLKKTLEHDKQLHTQNSFSKIIIRGEF